jgi:hypothetical protein
MPNAQLDQFIYALEMKAVPVLVLATIAGGLLGLLFKWFEHGLIRLIRSARAGRKTRRTGTNTNVGFAGVVPHCPVCNSQNGKTQIATRHADGPGILGLLRFSKVSRYARNLIEIRDRRTDEAKTASRAERILRPD